MTEDAGKQNSFTLLGTQTGVTVMENGMVFASEINKYNHDVIQRLRPEHTSQSSAAGGGKTARTSTFIAASRTIINKLETT